MKKKQFKTESKKLLDMMINSIYTNREIFLRELISNASDAIDKLYFRSLTEEGISLSRSDYAIFIEADKAKRTLTITDNGCGMSAEEMESNLGTIAKSGSLDFKRGLDGDTDVDIIGQFGVGFYSAFMVADRVVVTSRPYGSSTAVRWESEGADGYTLGECERDSFGTSITLYIKDDKDEENYSEFLEEYTLRSLIKKYSDYIRYPIKLEIERTEKTEEGERTERRFETVNSMIPIWKRPASEVSAEDYNEFYKNKYYDFEAPARTITQKLEGTATFTMLLFIPKRAPFNYYTREYEKGLELYSSGVMIMEKCSELLPDYFSFVKGLVDSSDLTLNISRETLQHDRQLRVIAKAVEKKVKSELEKMLESDRETYEQFFDAFGIQLKYGVYADFGAHKDTLKDLLLFRSSEGKYVSLKEYVAAMKGEQKSIYYASGESIEKINMLPQVATVKSRGFEVLYLTDDVDEFALRVLESYDGKSFLSVTADSLDIASEEEKASAKAENESSGDLLGFMKEAISDVSAVRFTTSLTDHPVCLTSEGDMTAEMARVLKNMPGADGNIPNARLVLEINMNHPITAKLKSLYDTDKDTLTSYAKILYAEACLISGVELDDPAELARMITELMI